MIWGLGAAAQHVQPSQEKVATSNCPPRFRHSASHPVTSTYVRELSWWMEVIDGSPE